MYLKIKLLKEVPKISQFTSHQHGRQQRSSDKLTVQDSKFQLYLTELGSCQLGGKTQGCKSEHG